VYGIERGFCKRSAGAGSGCLGRLAGLRGRGWLAGYLLGSSFDWLALLLLSDIIVEWETYSTRCINTYSMAFFRFWRSISNPMSMSVCTQVYIRIHVYRQVNGYHARSMLESRRSQCRVHPLLHYSTNQHHRDPNQTIFSASSTNSCTLNP